MLKIGDFAPPLFGQPVFGLPIKLGVGSVPTVVVFLRGLSSPVARAAVAAVQAKVSPWDARGVSVVGVTRTELESARDFIPRYHVLFPVLLDPEGRFFESFGVGRDALLKGTLLQPSRFGDFLASLNTYGQGPPERPLDQLQAAFLIGRDGRIVVAAYAKSILEGPDLAAVEAGMEGL